MDVVIKMTNQERDAFLASVLSSAPELVTQTIEEFEPVSRTIIESESHWSESKQTWVEVDDMAAPYVVNTIRKTLREMSTKDVINNKEFHALVYKLAELFEEMDVELYDYGCPNVEAEKPLYIPRDSKIPLPEWIAKIKEPLQKKNR